MATAGKPVRTACGTSIAKRQWRAWTKGTWSTAASNVGLSARTMTTASGTSAATKALARVGNSGKRSLPHAIWPPGVPSRAHGGERRIRAPVGRAPMVENRGVRCAGASKPCARAFARAKRPSGAGFYSSTPTRRANGLACIPTPRRRRCNYRRELEGTCAAQRGTARETRLTQSRQ